ncbi:hypothetical protein C9374_008025 [Naegleria lovaniensis]|uniref:Histone deacetylase domain-containing protein n=1 Tax=Naegleria lovaniensis TaxID=51637 RepID=A0AA88GG79_NAELO|nr:uncharacterized protein C9374_008025 [Naegleria lovaniensis]KAG2378877.1 hypothetical protein C9374_008025 [Naegleria lovaniensis]
MLRFKSQSTFAVLVSHSSTPMQWIIPKTLNNHYQLAYGQCYFHKGISSSSIPSNHHPDENIVTEIHPQGAAQFFSCYSSAQFAIPTTHTHKPKWIQVPQLLKSCKYVLDNEIKTPQQIPIEIVKQVHDHEYVERFLNGTITHKEMKRWGFESGWNEQVRNRVLHTIGATLCATQDALFHNYSRRSSNLAGGGHHAFHSKGGGYCIWNDIIIAGQYLINSGFCTNGRKYLVIDLDVHQGDGTARLARDLHEGKSFTFSMHCKHNFPEHKEKSDWDIELENGMKDDQYLKILEKCLFTLEQEFKEKIDFIFYQSGVDVLEGDRLGLLCLSPAGVLRRDQMVVEFAERMAQHDPKFNRSHGLHMNGIPLISMMGGGYIRSENGNPLERVAQAHAETVNTLRNHWKSNQNARSRFILPLQQQVNYERTGRWRQEMDDRPQVY